jgi:hypothetical protein
MTLHSFNQERMTSYGSPRRDFISDLNEAIRQNPLPAALVGAGVLWLFMGGAKNSALGGAAGSLFSGIGYGAQQAGGLAYRGAQGVGGAISAGASSIAGTASEVGSQAAGAVRSAAEALSGAANQAASQVSEAAATAYDAAGNMIDSAGNVLSQTASSGSRSVRESGSEMSKGFQQTLTDMFAQQPLLLGAVGIAVGAALAAAMPATEVENRLMGDSAESLKNKAEDLWSETTKRAEAMGSKALEEAKSQGFTPQAAGQALRGVTEKAMGVADKAKEGVTSRVKGQNAGESSGGLRH